MAWCWGKNCGFDAAIRPPCSGFIRPKIYLFCSWEPMIFLVLILYLWRLLSRSLLPFYTTRTTLSLFVSAKPFWDPILYSTRVFARLTNMSKRSSKPSLMSFSGAIEAFGKLPRDFSLVMVSTSIGRGNISFFGVSEVPF